MFIVNQTLNNTLFIGKVFMRIIIVTQYYCHLKSKQK